MSKKRSNSFHRPAVVDTHRKKSDLIVHKKKPLQPLYDANHANIPRQRSIPKVPKDPQTKKHNKNYPSSPPKRKYHGGNGVSPRKFGGGDSNKKSQKSNKSKSKSRRSKGI